MTDRDTGFDAHLTGLFEDSAPRADPQFTAGVLAALPQPARTRPLLLALAGLLGLAVAAWQLPYLITVLDALFGGAAALALDAFGAQALAMGAMAAALTGVTVFLFRRGSLDL